MWKILEFTVFKLEQRKKKEMNFTKFIWFRGEENYFLRFYKVQN